MSMLSPNQKKRREQWFFVFTVIIALIIAIVYGYLGITNNISTTFSIFITLIASLLGVVATFLQLKPGLFGSSVNIVQFLQKSSTRLILLIMLITITLAIISTIIFSPSLSPCNSASMVCYNGIGVQQVQVSNNV